MAKKAANQIIQTHHITYVPERTVLVRKTEHFILTTMQRMKVPTKGFLIALQQYIRDNRHKAVSGKQIKRDNKLKEVVNGKRSSKVH